MDTKHEFLIRTDPEGNPLPCHHCQSERVPTALVEGNCFCPYCLLTDISDTKGKYPHTTQTTKCMAQGFNLLERRLTDQIDKYVLTQVLPDFDDRDEV